MSELIQKNDNRATIRWKLLTGASALALIVSAPVMADDETGHPLFWIELGANADAFSGTGQRFSAPFLTQTPKPATYSPDSPIDLQKPPRFAFGGEGKLSFQPKDSDWVFSAGILDGRSNNKRDVQHQRGLTVSFENPIYTAYINFGYTPDFLAGYGIFPTKSLYGAEFAETVVNQSESHLVLDFQAGKDVGFGMFSHGGSSVLSGGVRLARFSWNSKVDIKARPNLDFYDALAYGKYPVKELRFGNYYLDDKAERNFSGIGPSISWNSSAPLAGNIQNGELLIDWGINGAVLFGRQRAKISHHTTARDFSRAYRHSLPASEFPGQNYVNTNYITRYQHDTPIPTRSRRVTVPNFGANIGLTYRIENTKVSLGYRADYFFGAMDGGIDAAKKTTLGFNGLYASVSVGLGD